MGVWLGRSTTPRFMLYMSLSIYRHDGPMQCIIVVVQRKASLQQHCTGADERHQVFISSTKPPLYLALICVHR